MHSEVFWVSYQMPMLAPGQADLSLPSRHSWSDGVRPRNRDSCRCRAETQEARERPCAWGRQSPGMCQAHRAQLWPSSTLKIMCPSPCRWSPWSKACRCWWAGWRACSTMPSATLSTLRCRTSPRSPSGSRSGRPSRRRRTSSRGQPCCTHCLHSHPKLKDQLRFEQL